MTKRDGDLAARFYGTIIHEVELVSTPREAEMAKLIENTFRHVNIALVNELAFIVGTPRSFQNARARISSTAFAVLYDHRGLEVDPRIRSASSLTARDAFFP